MDHRRPIRPPPPARRALFQTSSTTAASASYTSASRRAGDGNAPAHLNLPAGSQRAALHIASTSPSPPATAARARSESPVERDSTGNYKILSPTTATARRAGVDAGGMWLHGPVLEYKDEHERQMIALYGRENGHWDQAAILEEVRVALQASLERKVQSLELDRWMFEGDGGKKR